MIKLKTFETSMMILAVVAIIGGAAISGLAHSVYASEEIFSNSQGLHKYNNEPILKNTLPNSKVSTQDQDSNIHTLTNEQIGSNYNNESIGSHFSMGHNSFNGFKP